MSVTSFYPTVVQDPVPYLSSHADHHYVYVVLNVLRASVSSQFGQEETAKQSVERPHIPQGAIVDWGQGHCTSEWQSIAPKM